jgi:hypothetical protein
MTVTVSGYGNTPDDAEKSAIQKAVRKAIGEFVDAETIAQNGELIKDEVLTYSDGFVESKKILTGPEKDPDLGVFAITIEAKVVRNKLIERLKESKISFSEVSGDDLWTQAVSKVENVQDGRALLNKFVNEEMLPERLLVAEVVSNDSAGNLLRGNEAKPSQRPDYDKGTSELSFFIEVRYDLEAYYGQVVPRLVALLEKICQAKIAEGASVSPMSTNSLNPPLSAHPTKTASMPTRGMNWLGFTSKRLSTRQDKLYYGQTNRPLWSIDLSAKPPPPDSLFVALNVGRDKTGNFQRFTVYQLDGRAYAKFFMEAPARRIPELSFSLLTDEDQVLIKDKTPLKQHYLEEKGVIKKSYFQHGLIHAAQSSSYGSSPVGQASYHCATISPWFQDVKSYLNDAPVILRKFNLAQEDVKRIARVRLEFGE